MDSLSVDTTMHDDKDAHLLLDLIHGDQHHQHTTDSNSVVQPQSQRRRPRDDEHDHLDLNTTTAQRHPSVSDTQNSKRQRVDVNHVDRSAPNAHIQQHPSPAELEPPSNAHEQRVSQAGIQAQTTRGTPGHSTAQNANSHVSDLRHHVMNSTPLNHPATTESAAVAASSGLPNDPTAAATTGATTRAPSSSQAHHAAFQPGSAEYDLASLLANVKGTTTTPTQQDPAGPGTTGDHTKVNASGDEVNIKDQEARGEQDSKRRLSTSSQSALAGYGPARAPANRNAAEMAYAALSRSRALYPAVTSQEYHDSIHEDLDNGLNEDDFDEEEEDDDGLDQPMMSGNFSGSSRRHKPSAMQHLHAANTSSRSGRKIKASSKQQAAAAASQYVSSAEALMSVIRSTKGHRVNNKPSGSKSGSSPGSQQGASLNTNKGGSSGIVDEGNTGGGLYSGTTNPRHTNECPGPSKIPSKDAAEMFPGLPSAPAPCPFEGCGKMFGRRSDFKRHWRVHSGERPWRCDVPGCDKGFVQKTALTIHQRVHSGEKPHICTFNATCLRAFADSSSLQRHMKSHLGTKEFVCDRCSPNTSFSRKATLKRHQTWCTGPGSKKPTRARKTSTTTTTGTARSRARARARAGSDSGIKGEDYDEDDEVDEGESGSSSRGDGEDEDAEGEDEDAEGEEIEEEADAEGEEADADGELEDDIAAEAAAAAAVLMTRPSPKTSATLALGSAEPESQVNTSEHVSQAPNAPVNGGAPDTATASPANPTVDEIAAARASSASSTSSSKRDVDADVDDDGKTPKRAVRTRKPTQRAEEAAALAAAGGLY